MESLTGLTELLLIATLLGLILRKLNVSPVIGYLIAGLLGAKLGINYNSQIFQFLTFLAVNLLSFEMGISVNLLELKKIFSKAIFIVLSEITIISAIVSIISLILKLNLLSTLFLIIIGFNTSSSIAYKLASGKLDPSELKMILTVSSIEDTVAFIFFGVIISNSFDIIGIILGSLISITLGYVVSRFLINPIIEYNDSLILSSVASIFLFNILSQLLDIPTSLGSFLLGVGTSYASREPEKVEESLRSLTDFTLILFFFTAGSYMKISQYLIYALPISLILVFAKYIAFSFSYWISGVDFLRAFRTGLYMSSLSEFGIVISLTALQDGLPIVPAYNISTLVVAVSSTIASIVTNRVNEVVKLISKVYYYLKLERIDNIIKTNTFLRFKIPSIVIFLTRYYLISLIITFSGIYLTYLLYTINPYLIFLSLMLISIIPAMLTLFLLSSIKHAREKYAEFKFMIEIILLSTYLFDVYEYIVFFVKIFYFNSILLLLSIILSALIAILSVSRIKKILEDLEKIF